MYKAKNSISLKLASPEKVLESSYGEVLKPETINYRSYKPEKDGLFCEKIFGPVKDFECHCGKYKGIRYRGIICDRCGVEVTTKKVRRNRMGHITLAVPVVHIWFLKSIPSKLSYILGKSAKQLESVVYYENYLIINPGKSPYKRFDLIDEEAYLEMESEFGYEAVSQKEKEEESHFYASMGGQGLKDALSALDLLELENFLKLNATLPHPAGSKAVVSAQLLMYMHKLGMHDDKNLKTTSIPAIKRIIDIALHTPTYVPDAQELKILYNLRQEVDRLITSNPVPLASHI